MQNHHNIAVRTKYKTIYKRPLAYWDIILFVRIYFGITGWSKTSSKSGFSGTHVKLLILHLGYE